jgi:hypothetical protein
VRWPLPELAPFYCAYTAFLPEKHMTMIVSFHALNMFHFLKGMHKEEMFVRYVNNIAKSNEKAGKLDWHCSYSHHATSGGGGPGGTVLDSGV